MKIEVDWKLTNAYREIGRLTDAIGKQMHNFGRSVQLAAALSGLGALIAKLCGEFEDVQVLMLFGLVFVASITSIRIELALYRRFHCSSTSQSVVVVYEDGGTAFFEFLLLVAVLLSPLYIDFGVYYLALQLFGDGANLQAAVVTGLFVLVYPVAQTALLLYRLVKLGICKHTVSQYQLVRPAPTTKKSVGNLSN